MKFRTDATRKQDVEDAELYSTLLVADVAADIELSFAGPLVKLFVNGEEYRTNRKGWNVWRNEGFPHSGTIPLWGGKVVEDSVLAVVPPTPEPTPDATGRVEDSYLTDLAHQAYSIAVAERNGESGKNAARFRRGELMLELSAVAKGLGVKMKTALADLNDRALLLAESNAMLEYKPIDPSEASVTRRVVEAFGSSADFNLVGALNPLTGDPLVGDDGRPMQVPITDVAVNKLAPLTEYADEDHNLLLSFAYRHTEKVVKRAKAAAKRLDVPLSRVVERVNDARVNHPHPATGDIIAVQPMDRDAMNVLAELMGEAPVPDVVSIKTSRGFYESYWLPLRGLISKVVETYQPDMKLDGDGQVSNAFVFEQIIAQFFNVLEDEGLNATLAALVKSEAITKEQAVQFLSDFMYDSNLDEWVMAPGKAAARAKAVAAEVTRQMPPLPRKTLVPPEEPPVAEDEDYDDEFEDDDPKLVAANTRVEDDLEDEGFEDDDLDDADLPF